MTQGSSDAQINKAVHEEDTAHVTGDKGIMVLGVRQDVAAVHAADNYYIPLIVDELGSLHVGTPKSGRGLDTDVSDSLDAMDATTGWTVLGNDTVNLATTLNHVEGTAALTFDKADGAANTVFAGIQKTITSIDLSSFTSQDLILTDCLLPSVADADYIFVRLGTDSSNYNEWRVPADLLADGAWQTVVFNIGNPEPTGFAGNGWDPSAVTYLASGVAFDNQNNTLAGIILDNVGLHSSSHTTTVLKAEITSEVSSPNVNIKKWGAVNVTNAATLADNMAVPKAPLTGACLMLFDGSAYDRASGNSANGLTVNLANNNDVHGNVAHDASDQGNPLKIGGIARDLAETTTAVAKDDRVDASFTRDGRMLVETGHPDASRLG